MRLAIDKAAQFVENVFMAMGFSATDAHTATQVLIAAELRNIPSHGIIRLREYIALWQQNRINTKAQPHIVRERKATALIDADFGLGLITADYAMQLAINKAKESGIAWVSVKRSHHYGIAGHHALKAVKHNMIGISMTNANPLVAPTYSAQPLLGTNPIAVAIPAGRYPAFVADFATAPIARGKLDILHQEGNTVPEDLVQDADGKLSLQANILTKGGAIRSLGGTPEKGSHKGFCMSALVDILSAVLPGANFATTVVPTLGYIDKNNKPIGDNQGIGHMFAAVDIDAFQDVDSFKSKMDDWIDIMKAATPISPQTSIIIPGEPEWQVEKEHQDKGYIKLSATLEKELQKMANTFGLVTPYLKK